MTADIIMQALNGVPAVERVDWLTEIDHGPDENQLETDIVARIGIDALDAWNNEGRAPPGWNVARDERIAAWLALFATVESGHQLVVTSNGMARFALIAMGVAATGCPLRLRTGALGEISFAAGAPGEVLRWDVRPGD